ncbi:ran exchange factor prp20 [Ophiostoma piceae UAMH 11346]|uniref:Ran exchange factor prp20 n=1 Tax=Ophiostoma piceae (strain UAMH 11346) TaxID=1262450 RepID=S3BSV8_OPHP1|nr:ran exchange factor prp20 [Ophiostoma piceae UAMH 11346]
MGAKPDALQRRGTTITRPMQVAALTDQCGIALTWGGHHPVAVTADGRCLAWGRVDGGQLGVELDAAQITDETLVMTDDSGRPHICLRAVVVGSDSLAPDEKVIGVACDTRHTLIVASVASHVVLCAGFHMQAQLGLSRDADDEVSFATRLGGKVLQQRGMAWACAGGQFSMVAGPRPCS